MPSQFREIKNIALQYVQGENGNIFQNIAWLFFEHVSRMVFGLFVGAWVARYLGAEEFGVISYALAFTGLLNPIARLGLDALVIRSFVHEPELKDKILGTAFWMKLVASLVSYGFVLALVVQIRPGQVAVIQVTAILTVASIFQAFDVIDLWFRSQVQSKFTVIAKNSALIVIAGAKVLLILSGASLLAFAWIMLAETALGIIAMLGIYYFQGHQFSLAWNLSLAKQLLHESWPLILSGLSIMIYMKIDQIMLGEMLGDEATGLYAAATKLSEIWYFVPTAIAASVAPSIYAAKKKSATDYYRKVKKLIRLLTQISLLFAIPISLASRWIVTIIYGQEYILTGQILSIHIWASPFVFMGVATSPWIIAEQLTKISLAKNSLGAVLNIVLNYFLISSFSVIGAAIATIISQAFSAYFSNLLFKETKDIFLAQSSSFLFNFRQSQIL